MNWINSWQEGNKKEKYNIEIRLGTITILELKYCACSEKKCAKLRIMMFNLGFEI
tara:strand:+ start:2081 stop:2245 length:165 start_codon:yes stop_codon:yes gene_type:complete